MIVRSDHQREVVGERRPSPRRLHERQENVMSERSGWAVGYSMFAAIMLMMIGVFHFMAGLVGIIDDEFYVVTGNWVFEFDATTWGWIHLIGGVLVVLAGFSVVKGHMYGRIIGTMRRGDQRDRQLRMAPVPAVVEHPDDRPVGQPSSGRLPSTDATSPPRPSKTTVSGIEVSDDGHGDRPEARSGP